MREYRRQISRKEYVRDRHRQHLGCLTTDFCDESGLDTNLGACFINALSHIPESLPQRLKPQRMPFAAAWLKTVPFQSGFMKHGLASFESVLLFQLPQRF